ncbi:MAG TPA: two-component regulator propeller domain-containing protein, partial [Chitinophagaceae bacterium]|nr:two-component regulator propeller domain-containing protein [Chitinophagaceae bacterium]
MLREKAFQSYNFVHRFTAQMILCILLCVPAITHAQNKPVRFEHCSVRQGLSQGSGYSITQDKYGFIWMGTQYGLNRFDGYQVKTFFHGDKGYTGSNHINSLYTDSNGNVWVASTSGLSILESSTRKFTTASRFLKDQTGLDQLNVTKLWGDQRHHVWALSASNTVFQIKPSSTGWLTTAFRLPARPVDITEDGKGTIWLATEHDIFQFDGSRRLFVKRPIPQLSGYVISALVVDKEDRLWVGTFDNGIYLISLHGKNEKTPIRLVEGKDEGSISSNAVTCLLKDNQNDIWIGTRTGGLNKYQNGKIIQNRHGDDVAESLAKDFVLSLFEDRQGNIWVGLSGEGFDKHDPSKFQFQSIRHSQHDPSTIGDNMIFAIRRLVPGYLHFGTQLSGLSVLDESSGKFVNFKKDLSGANSIIHNTVYDLAYDGKGL